MKYKLYRYASCASLAAAPTGQKYIHFRVTSKQFLLQNFFWMFLEQNHQYIL